MTRLRHLLLALTTAVATASAAHAADTVDRITAANHLRCGTIAAPQDWNKIDLHGNLVPLEEQFCHGLAAALFGDATRVTTLSFNAEQDGLAALRHNQADIVIGVTPSVNTARAMGVRYSRPIFQDAQGFMVHKDSGIHGPADMAGRKLCTIDDTDNGPIALAALAAQGVRPIPFGFQEEGEMDAAIDDRHCEIASAMLSKLAEARSGLKAGHNFVLLPDLVALSPVTAAANAPDDRLIAIMNTTIDAVLQAEYLGVTQSSITTIGHTDDPRVARLTGQDWATAAGLNLPHDWSRNLIAAVGNYAEIYDRTIGPGTELDLPRGLNALWNKGGLMAPQPLQ